VELQGRSSRRGRVISWIATWPERILCGHGNENHQNACKKGFPQSEIRRHFPPATKTGENVARRSVRARFDERSADARDVDTCAAGVRCTTRLDDRPADP
jgi:hypothetical protein